MSKQAISAAYPFQSNFLEVKGSKIHYVDVGDKQAAHTFLLLHGNPTWSYLWRNIIPHLEPYGRVVAPDLIGMGKSDKPDIAYTFKDHIDYIDGFIAGLGLKHIIPVIQDWGSGIGFHYAKRHPQHIAGIVFFEAITRAIEWSDANFMERLIFKTFRHPKRGYNWIVKRNFFVKRFLPMMAGRKLTKEEMTQYHMPYLREADRKPVWIWPTQIAIGGEPEFSTRIIREYEQYLPTTTYPKLMFHVKPGMIIKPKEAAQIKATWNNLTAVDLGKGKHYLQEQYPHEIGTGIVKWYQQYF